MFLTVCLNPTLQKTVLLRKLVVGEVNRAVLQRLDASGKGVNVSRVLSRLNGDVVHLSQCGGWNGLHFLQLAEADGLKMETVDSGVEVRFCQTILDEASGTTTEIVEEGSSPQPGTEDGIRSRFESLIDQAHTLIISGTKAAGFSDDLYPWMVKVAKSKKIRVAVDFRGKDLLNCLPFAPDIIKPNVAEFMETFFPEENLDGEGLSGRLIEKMEKGMLEIHREYRSLVVCTHGGHGVFVAASEKVFKVDVPPVKPVNTIGCGDSFLAGLVFSLNRGGSLQNALDEAIRCASLNAVEFRPGWIPG